MISQEDLNDAVKLVVESWDEAIKQHITDEELIEKIEATAAINMMRGLVVHLEKMVSDHFNKSEVKEKLSPEDVEEIKRQLREQGNNG